jgi:hypothetical protein
MTSIGYSFWAANMDVHLCQKLFCVLTLQWQQSVVPSDIPIRLGFRLAAPIASDLWVGCYSKL